MLVVEMVRSSQFLFRVEAERFSDILDVGLEKKESQ